MAVFYYLKLRFKWDIFLFLAILGISVYNNVCLWSAFKLFSSVIVEWSLSSEKKQKKEYMFPDSLTLCSVSVKGHTITDGWPWKQMYTHRDIYMYGPNGTPQNLKVENLTFNVTPFRDGTFTDFMGQNEIISLRI